MKLAGRVKLHWFRGCEDHLTSNGTETIPSRAFQSNRLRCLVARTGHNRRPGSKPGSSRGVGTHFRDDS